MKRKLGIAIAMLALLFFAIITGATQVSAQQPTPMPGEPISTPTPDMEHRIYELEVAQDQTIHSLESTNEQNRSIIVGAGTIIGILVAIQGLATGAAISAQVVQLYREGRRDRRQAHREKERDQIDRTSVEQVSKVMDVVQKTLASRIDIEHESFVRVSEIMNVVRQTFESQLETEKRARTIVEEVRTQLQDQQKQLQRRLDDALKKIDRVGEFQIRFQENIRKERAATEEHALQLAQTSRHDFRHKTSELNSFAEKFDNFDSEFKTLEEKPRPFNPRVLYIRGIAAHYANQPGIASKYLDMVVRSREPEPDEDQRSYNRRTANAYYYLGLNQSNFADYNEAIRLFQEANKLDPQVGDFLTRIVTAEAYVMVPDFDGALQFIGQVEKGIETKRDRNGRLPNFYLRLQSRAILVKANIVILRRGDNWHREVQDLLEPVCATDSQYYYAIATLAQVCHDQGNKERAQGLFHKAYATIQDSGHLITVTEARSKILLEMVAGMCCKHSPQEEIGRLNEHLDKAKSFVDNLPKMDSQTCTVFSTLSKQNEKSDVILNHIELIRQGDVLL